MHREVSDGELPVVVVLHIVTLQALIVLQEAVREGYREREREERCVGLTVLTTVGAVKSCTDREVTDTTRS